MDPSEFSRKVFYAVRVANTDLGRFPACIVTAHAAFESGWGKSRPAQLGNNIFSITRLPSSPLPILESPDLEYTASGVKKITQRFAKYESYEEAISDYFRFIKKLRYHPSYQVLLSGDMIGYISTLRQGGYFTLPLESYLARMSRILGTVCKTVLEEL